VPREQTDMLRIADSEIDVPSIRIVSQADSEVIVRNQISCSVTGHNMTEM